MKSKLTLTALAALLGVSALFFHRPKEQPADPGKISGAYEALNFLSAQRIYPHEHLPERAYYAAWEQLRQSATLRSGPQGEPWESMGPHNIGGRTLAIAFNPQNPRTMYLGSASGGLWRSYTAGAGALAWERVGTGFPVLAVSSVAFAPGDSTVMYIGTGEVYNFNLAGTGAAYRSTRGSYGIGILKSTDGGSTWEKSLDWAYNQQHGVWAVKVAPGDPNVVYAATTQGVFRSNDAGASWGQVHDVVMATDLLIHPDDPNRVVVGCGNFSSPGFGIYRTTDGGENWTKATAGVPAQFNGKIQLGMAPGSPNVIYASIGNGFSQADGGSWLCRSSNFGASWTVRTTIDYSQWQGWFSHDVAVSPNNANELAVVGINVWKSINGGNSITVTAGGGEVHADCHDVTYHPTDPNIVFVATDGGLFRSDDGGEQYYPANGGYQTVQFYNGFSNSAQDSALAFGGLQDNGSIRWTGSEDLSWTPVFGGDGGWSAVDQQNDSRVFVSWQGLNIQRSINGGDSFQPVVPPGNEFTAFIAPYVIAQDNADIIYAGRANVYKSENVGDSWAVTGDGNGLDGNPILSMAISPQNSDVVYAATAPIPGSSTHGVFVTVNGGDTWQNITAPNLPDRFPMDLTVGPTDEATAYITYSGFGSGHLFRTDNYGESWEDLSEGLPDVPTNAVVADPLFPDIIYVGNDLGVFASSDGGQNWIPLQEGLPEAVMVFDLVISPANRKLRVATHGNGAYQKPLLDEITIGTEEAVAGAFEQSVRLFPNPVRESASLQYELESPARVTVQLLDSKGAVLKKLVGEAQPAGFHEVPFNRQGLSAGLYFLRLQAGGKRVTKRVIVR
ncbi:MAG: T9SS type A sorting domain-containing protein [Lewinellaceae bacterium]|nr:T9SS type A sorting domain-containing protein [Lewinellaceae bacterium]